MTDHRIDFEFIKSYLKITLKGCLFILCFHCYVDTVPACGIQSNSCLEVLNNLAYISIQIIQIITTWNLKYKTLSEAEISPKLVEHKK